MEVNGFKMVKSVWHSLIMSEPGLSAQAAHYTMHLSLHMTPQYRAFIGTGSHMWQPCNKHTLLCSQGQRRRAFRRPAAQAEEPERLNQHHWWIQGPREHGRGLQPAAVRGQAERPAHLHLHGRGPCRHIRVPGERAGLQWVKAAAGVKLLLWKTVRIPGRVQLTDHLAQRPV